MKIKVNGEELDVRSGISLPELLKELSLEGRRIVVEHNRELLLPDKVASVFLKDGDTLELVSFVGGG